jgi:hypothetical protein
MTRQVRTSILLVAGLAAVVAFGVYRLHQPGLAKDEVATIGEDAGQVILRGDRNQIRWREGEVVHHWVGQPRTQSETVYFDGRDVHRATWAEVFSRQGFLIRFLPGRVDVIDLDNLRGEYYSPRTN